jgi:hypothetical protein
VPERLGVGAAVPGRLGVPERLEVLERLGVGAPERLEVGAAVPEQGAEG